MDKPLRILAIIDLPWDPRLGGSRVYIELTNQWKAAGHSVEKYCLDDAFPQPTNSRVLSALRQMFFAIWAGRFVRANASRFDVIDALIGTLPFSKNNLGFTGLLVARSTGLYRAYEEFVWFSKKRWPDQPRGKFFGRVFYQLKRRWLRHNSDRAVVTCDILNLPNEAEVDFLRKAGLPEKPVLAQPYGLD